MLGRNNLNKIIESTKSDMKLIENLPDRVTEAIEEIANGRVRKGTEACMEQFSTCFSAAIVSLNPEAFTYEELIKIDDIAKTYFIENGQFIHENSDWRGVLDRMEQNVLVLIKELLDNNIKQDEIVRRVKREYPQLKSSHIQLAFKTAKEEWLKPTITICKDEDDAVAELNLSVLNKEKGIEMEKIELSKKAKSVIEPVENKFKVKSREIIFDGEFGEYKINGQTLIKGDLLINNFAEIAKFEKQEIEKIKARANELRQAFTMV